MAPTDSKGGSTPPRLIKVATKVNLVVRPPRGQSPWTDVLQVTRLGVVFHTPVLPEGRGPPSKGR